MINAGGSLCAILTNLKLIGEASVPLNTGIRKPTMQNLCDAIEALLKSDIKILFIDSFSVRKNINCLL